MGTRRCILTGAITLTAFALLNVAVATAIPCGADCNTPSDRAVRQPATVAADYVLVRSGPGTNYASTGRLNKGTRVSIVCQTRGTVMSGPRATKSPWWNRLSAPVDGWVSDAFIDSGPNARAARNCRRHELPGKPPTNTPPPNSGTTPPNPGGCRIDTSTYPPRYICPPPPRRKKACKDQIGPQRVSIDFLRRSEFVIASKQDGKQNVRQHEAEVRRFGTLTFKVTTCEDPRDGWVVNQSASVAVDPVRASGISFNEIDGTFKPQGKGSARGWGIQLYDGGRSAEPVIAVKGMHCKDGGYGKAVLVELLGLPFPIWYPLSIVQYAGQKAAAKFIPDPKVKCADMGVETVRVGSDKQGCARVQTDGRMNGSFTDTVESPGTTPDYRVINTVRGRVHSSVIRYHGSTDAGDPDCKPKRATKRLRGGPTKD